MDHYNQKSYFKSLENINKIKKLSKKQTIFAKKFSIFRKFIHWNKNFEQ